MFIYNIYKTCKNNIKKKKKMHRYIYRYVHLFEKPNIHLRIIFIIL